jgi:hypothetical protein
MQPICTRDLADDVFLFRHKAPQGSPALKTDVHRGGQVSHMTVSAGLALVSLYVVSTVSSAAAAAAAVAAALPGVACQSGTFLCRSPQMF